MHRFDVSAEGVTHGRLDLGRSAQMGELPSDVLGMAVHGDRWAVAWRLGPVEDMRSRVFLATATAEPEVEALHHALALDTFVWNGDAVLAIASQEFSRPQRLRLMPDGTVDGEVVVVPPGERPGAPARPTAELEAAEVGLSLVRRTGAGDPMGEHSPLADARSPADLTQVDGGYLLAHRGEISGLFVRHLRCR
jgi:hypothetical protein